MQKVILATFAAALLAGSMVEAAAAAQRHHVARIYRAAPVASEPFRDSYAYEFREPNVRSWSYPDYSYWASHLEGDVISAPAGR